MQIDIDVHTAGLFLQDSEMLVLAALAKFMGGLRIQGGGRRHTIRWWFGRHVRHLFIFHSSTLFFLASSFTSPFLPPPFFLFSYLPLHGKGSKEDISKENRIYSMEDEAIYQYLPSTLTKAIHQVSLLETSSSSRACSHQGKNPTFT